ncbi:MAG: PAS domain-containing protein [Chloroflexi bacterium]|nr:PAS domain-containing protein [Chloroflexota bacterium]
MRIRTQFVITMLLFGAVLAAVAASAVVTSRMVESAREQGNLADSVAQGASELSYLANDYLIHREDRQLNRWQARFDTFSGAVARLEEKNPAQQGLVRSIRANTTRLEDVFKSIVAAIGSDSPGPGGTLDPVALSVSWSRIAVQSQALVSDASRLSNVQENQVSQLQTTNDTIIIILIVVLLAYFLINYLLTQRRALSGLARLQSGAAAIGTGNLDYRIEVKGNDEIGDLSRAFNRMTGDLKLVTASKAELEREIDERKKAEEATEAHRQLLDTTFRNVPVQVNLMGSDLRIMLVNPAYQAIAPGKEMIGKNLDELWPETRQQFVELCRRVLATGEPYHAVDEFNMVASYPGGPPEPRYFTWSLYRVDLPKGGRGILNVAWETTERKKAVEALRASEQRWVTTLSSIGDAVIATDTKGLITFLNPVAERLTGWSYGEAVGKPVLEVFNIVNEDSRETLENPVSKVLQTGLVTGLANHTVLVRRDGSIVPIDDSGAPIKDQAGQIAGAVLVFRDISERRSAEERVRTYERLATIGQLSGGVAHELKNPLASIDSAAYLLERTLAGNEATGRYLARIRNGVENCTRTIDALLAITRSQDMILKKIEMKSLLAEFISDNIPPGVQVVKNFPAEDVFIEADERQLRIAIRNIITNAVQAMRGNGTLTLGVRTVDDTVEASFGDTGHGISPENLRKVFEPLFTTKAKGLGMGLTITRLIVERQHGAITLDSRPGSGTTFILKFPALPARSEDYGEDTPG